MLGFSLMTGEILSSCQPHANLFFQKSFGQEGVRLASREPHASPFLAQERRDDFRLAGDFLDALRWDFHRASAPRIPPSRLPGCPAPTNPPILPRIDAISTMVKRPSLRMARSRSISARRSFSVMGGSLFLAVFFLAFMDQSFSLCSLMASQPPMAISPAQQSRIPTEAMAFTRSLPSFQSRTSPR